MTPSVYVCDCGTIYAIPSSMDTGKLSCPTCDEPMAVREVVDVLQQASNLVASDRHNVYGDPVANHERIAALVNVMLSKKLAPGKTVTAKDVALIMVCVKLSRLVESPNHADSFVDAAAYIAIASEV